MLKSSPQSPVYRWGKWHVESVGYLSRSSCPYIELILDLSLIVKSLFSSIRITTGTSGELQILSLHPVHRLNRCGLVPKSLHFYSASPVILTRWSPCHTLINSEGQASFSRPSVVQPIPSLVPLGWSSEARWLRVTSSFPWVFVLFWRDLHAGDLWFEMN